MIRNAESNEIEALANLWFDGWQDAHAAVVPAELKRLRTLESFAERLGKLLPDVRVEGPEGQPLGFCIVKDDELYQLYVSAEARGKGVAAALIADAEATLAAKGVETAWLACAIGNERAARFYEKCGWHRAGTFVSELPIEDGVFPLEVWRYEKSLRRDSRIVFQRADVDLLKELLHVFGDAFEDPDHYQSAVPSDGYLETLLAADNFIAVVAVAEGKVVGGLAAYVLKKFEQERSEIYIYDLAVLKPYRRRHIATGLMNKLREIANEIGAYIIFVQADLGDEPAIKLYEGLGTREDVLHFDIIP